MKCVLCEDDKGTDYVRLDTHFARVHKIPPELKVADYVAEHEPTKAALEAVIAFLNAPVKPKKTRAVRKTPTFKTSKVRNALQKKGLYEKVTDDNPTLSYLRKKLKRQYALHSTQKTKLALFARFLKQIGNHRKGWSPEKRVNVAWACNLNTAKRVIREHQVRGIRQATMARVSLTYKQMLILLRARVPLRRHVLRNNLSECCKELRQDRLGFLSYAKKEKRPTQYENAKEASAITFETILAPLRSEELREQADEFLADPDPSIKRWLTFVLRYATACVILGSFQRSGVVASLTIGDWGRRIERTSKEGERTITVVAIDHKTGNKGTAPVRFVGKAADVIDHYDKHLRPRLVKMRGSHSLFFLLNSKGHQLTSINRRLSAFQKKFGPPGTLPLSSKQVRRAVEQRVLRCERGLRDAVARLLCHSPEVVDRDYTNTTEETHDLDFGRLNKLVVDIEQESRAFLAAPLSPTF
jgi:hypothetical protein